ncbi:Itaconate transport protein [Lachnellula subtilissima]|uniref:Itaconate transport protein n=1 Tax=Lachnellula subtilissima TaxID=602034 RepID=A0A8H8RDF4_9HELO|nr:Itaconate transport protein [Lachnellula subtilissima]
MAQDEALKDAEKAEEVGASLQGAIVLEEAAETSGISHTPSPHADNPEDGGPDLEQLAAVTTGPPYSSFSTGQKRYIVLMVTWAAFVSPTSANIYFPALNPLKQDLGVSTTLINLTLTSYMIFQGLAPTIFGDLADMAGRRPTYILAFIIYLGANIGLALQNSYAALFILRCLQSTGSSGAIALGYGVVADISSSAERGKYMGIVGAGTMMGPAIGPVIGGILTQFLGWRSIFWFLVIVAGGFLVPFVLTVPETGRNVVGNGSIPPQGWNMTVLAWLRLRKELKSVDGLSRSVTAEDRRNQQAALAKRRKLRFPNPLKTVYIIMEKDMAVVLFYNALIYTAFYDMISSIPQQFEEIYGFNDLQIGLCYIPFGAGCALASFINGRMLDRNYKRVARQIGFTIDRKRGDDLRHFPIERARLELIWPLLGFGLSCYLCYGWVLEQNTNLAAPLILQFLIGLTVNGSFNILSTLIVDLYPQSPSTATAANNLVRCLMGAGGTAIISIMIEAMGRGWCYTFIALVCIAASPLLWIELKWGPGWREERRVRMDKAAEDQKRAEMELEEDPNISMETETEMEEQQSRKE